MEKGWSLESMAKRKGGGVMVKSIFRIFVCDGGEIRSLSGLKAITLGDFGLNQSFKRTLIKR